jgi:hypothetical protein
MAAFARISIDPAVRFGKPRLKDTRITRGEPRGHPLAPLDPQNNRLRRGS